MYGLTSDYLRRLRSNEAGPVFVRIGRMVRYRLADIQRWIEIAAIEVTPKRAS